MPNATSLTRQSEVVVVSDVIGQKAGAYRATFLLCRELAALGLDVTCFSTWIEQDGLEDESFRILGPRVTRGYRWDWPHRSLARRAIAHIRRERPDHVFVVGVTRLCRYLLQSPVADRLLVWELTNAEGNKFVDETASRLLPRCRAVMAPSQTIEHNLRRTYGYEGPVLRLPFWIEDEKLPYLPPPDEFLADFLFLGRREDDKGLRELIRATDLVRRSHPDVSVLIGGFGDDTPYRKLVEKLGIGQNVSFGEFPSRSDAMKALEASRFLVLPSYHEGYPLVLLEAAQRSVPILASSVGSIDEIFASTLCCRSFPPGNASELAESMRQSIEEASNCYSQRRHAANQLFDQLSNTAATRGNLNSLLHLPLLAC